MSASARDVDSLPPHQSNSFAWYGPQLAARAAEWTTRLTAADVQELETAAQRFQRSGRTIAAMTAQDFPLPTLGPRLRALRSELIGGRGFALLRGLPTGRYSEQEAALVFFGLGAHIGRARSQNAAGHLLGHVQDLGRSSSDPSVRVYQTRERQSFHTDSSDVVGLLCLQTARAGGESLLVSSTTIFNEMRRQRPELLRLLLQPIATDRRGEVPPGQLPYFLIPVFTYYQQQLTCIYQRQYVNSAQRFPDAPRLTAQHVQALDLLDSLADSPSLHLSMELQPGDVQLVYNHSLLHDRTAFVDFDEPARRRHLLRLWLTVPGDRPLAPVFASRFGSVTVGDRGGIVVADTELHVPASGR